MADKIEFATDKCLKIVDENTVVVTVSVNYDRRVLTCGFVSRPEEREDIAQKRTGTRVVDIILRRFPCPIRSADVISFFKINNMEPITPEDLWCLKFATESHHSLPLPIVALGAHWRAPKDSYLVLCLMSNKEERYMWPEFDHVEWGIEWWFAARREESDLKFGPENQPKK